VRRRRKQKKHRHETNQSAKAGERRFKHEIPAAMDRGEPKLILNEYTRSTPQQHIGRPRQSTPLFGKSSVTDIRETRRDKSLDPEPKS
jgi:hypothetical protein